MSFQMVTINKPDGAAVVPTGAVTRAETVLPGAAQLNTAAPTAPSDALTVVDLSKSFRSGFLKRRIRGIEGVSFTVERGTVFALLGHNGAGKTTTINCILDLVHASRGEVKIMGIDNRRCESRSSVGYLPERPYFFEHLTGQELLSFYARLLGLPRAERSARIEYVLGLTGMREYASRRLKKFSKGMLQRIGLAQTLLGDPDLLILDEPMSGLDPMGRREVRELLLDLKAQGKTIILSSHIVPDIELIADQVGIIRDGHMIETRDLREFRAKCAYQVHLGCEASPDSRLTLPTWAREQVNGATAGQITIAARNVDQLRELLAACHAAKVTVDAVDTQRTGLEEFFVNVHHNKQTEANS